MKKILIFSFVSVLSIANISCKNQERNALVDEQFLAQKLQTILEAKIKDIRHSATSAREHGEKQCDDFTQLSSAALGYSIALGMTLLILEKPQNGMHLFRQFCYLFLGVGIGGMLLHEGVIQPILRFFVVLAYRLFYDDAGDYGGRLYRDTITEFVRNWHEFKLFTPDQFHKKFDILYRQYMKHRGMILLSEEEAASLIDTIIEASLQMQNNLVIEGAK